MGDEENVLEKWEWFHTPVNILFFVHYATLKKNGYKMGLRGPVRWVSRQRCLPPSLTTPSRRELIFASYALTPPIHKYISKCDVKNVLKGGLGM